MVPWIGLSTFTKNRHIELFFIHVFFIYMYFIFEKRRWKTPLAPASCSLLNVVEAPRKGANVNSFSPWIVLSRAVMLSHTAFAGAVAVRVRWGRIRFQYECECEVLRDALRRCAGTATTATDKKGGRRGATLAPRTVSPLHYVSENNLFQMIMTPRSACANPLVSPRAPVAVHFKKNGLKKKRNRIQSFPFST